MPPDDAPEMGEQFPDIPEDHPIWRALRGARQDAREARARARLLEIQAKYPEMGFVADDFQGIDPGRWHEIADRLVAKVRASRPAPQPTAEKHAGSPASQAQPEAEQPAPPKAESSAEERVLARLQESPESVPNLGNERKLGVDEARKLLRKNPAEYMRLRNAGLIDLGVTVTDRGGSLIFDPRE